MALDLQQFGRGMLEGVWGSFYTVFSSVTNEHTVRAPMHLNNAAVDNSGR